LYCIKNHIKNRNIEDAEFYFLLKNEIKEENRILASRITKNKSSAESEKKAILRRGLEHPSNRLTRTPAASLAGEMNLKVNGSWCEVL
jgi:hypothetical protein